MENIVYSKSPAEYRYYMEYDPAGLRDLPKNGMVVYLCGSITNDPDYKKKFAYWTQFFQEYGYLVLNPVKFCMGIQKWSTCMKICFEVLKLAHFVAVLDLHIKSRGRDMEILEAEKLKTPVIDARSFDIKFIDMDYELLVEKKYNLNYII